MLNHLRRTANRGRQTGVRVALLGCTHCGHLLEEETDRRAGHLTGDCCPECGYATRVVDLAEAQQLTRERFLGAHWREIAALKRAAIQRDEATGELGERTGTQRNLPTGFRRPLLQRDEFDSNPRQLRENLRQ